MKIKRKYIREYCSKLGRILANNMYKHSCLPTTLPNINAQICLLCFTGVNPRYGHLYANLLRRYDILDQEALFEEETELIDLVGVGKYHQLVQNDFNSILKDAIMGKCRSCSNKVILRVGTVIVKCHYCRFEPIWDDIMRTTTAER